ncbi:hypothetical protein D9V84_03225 [Bacteroidetes/Chlorobi group bacterium Naka2016]|jgi:hypothetical protein|nr:MAG: hypothetical protein D9V84_03225 [Bacteroidetes/Chlorobi group bacterium Naka2016]
METALLNFIEETNSTIESFLKGFTNGINQAGAKVFELNIKHYQILDCIGCTEDIFFEPNGTCKCEDDFTSAYPFLQKSQYLVFAIDLDKQNLLKELNKVLLRMEPLFNFSFNGSLEQNTKKILLLLFSLRTSDLKPKVEEIIEEFANLYNYEYLGFLYRPDYHLLKMLPQSIARSFGFEESFTALGKELVATGKINSSIKEKIEREFLPQDSLFREIYALIGRR